MNVGDIQDVIEVALGGKTITMTVEGRERFPVRIRYARALREDEEQVQEPAGQRRRGRHAARGRRPMRRRRRWAGGDAGGRRPAPAQPVQIPLSMVADVQIVEGPAMIKSENGMLRSYVQLNVRDRDIVGFVEEAQRAVAAEGQAAAGHVPRVERPVRAPGPRPQDACRSSFPLVILLIFVILYLTYNDFVDAVLMMMAVPEALVGGVFFLWLFGFHFSVAVQVGFIACFGMATETGIIMLVYLREAIEKRGGLEKIGSLAELRAGGHRRGRPPPAAEAADRRRGDHRPGPDALGHRRGPRGDLGHGRPGARRPADRRRGGRHLHPRALLLGPPRTAG